MQNLQQIKQNRQAATDKLLDDCGVFFAFSNQQFEENKTPLNEGDKYISIGAGGYMPKSNANKFIQGMKDIEKGYKSELKKSKELRRENIRYELANHEAWYTGDITDTLAALGKDYKAKEVWKVYHEEAAKHETV